MNRFEMEKETYSDMLRTSLFGIPTLGIYMLGILVGELLISSGQVFSGIGIHTINMVAIILAIIFSSAKLEEKNVLQSLTLVILLRIIPLSMPQFFTSQLLQYSLIYWVMFVPIYFVVKNQNISYEDLGINFKKFHVYMPASVIIGTVIAIAEYQVMRPAPLADMSILSNVIIVSMTMLIFVGSVTEIIFRSIIQTRLEKIFDPKYAIIISGCIFGIMYVNYGIVGEVILATMFGIVNGYIFYKTKSLPFIVLINGTTNIMVFGAIGILSRMVI